MKITREDNGNFYSKDIRLLDSNNAGAVSEKTLEILRSIDEKGTYPKKIAEDLGVHEQKVYYHIEKLKEAGLVEVAKEERRGGALCKFYRPTTDSVGFEINDNWRESRGRKPDVPEGALDFFSEFVSGESFSGSIVVGSPKEHGPFMTASRDGHYAVQLGIFLGGFCNLEERFVVKLDTEVKAEEALDRNLILIGGPITNTVSRELNEELSVRFDWEKTWKIVSDKTGNTYSDENLGLVAKIENNGYQRILLSGLHFEGTKTCILGAIHRSDRVFDDYQRGEEFCRVIKGLDRDGDGKTDDIEILE
ncbi:MAG: S-layer protein [Candidatus Aenigmatarchaeota archaeon]